MMRAKMVVTSVTKNAQSETLKFSAVSKSGSYGPDGADEDNTYARWSPSAALEITIANPDLWGRFNEGDKFYLDFTPAT